MTGHETATCPVPGAGVSSTDGRPRWQWNPPGRYCVLPAGGSVGVAVPRVWNCPGEWRSILFVALMVTGVGLVGATAWGLRRDARRVGWSTRRSPTPARGTCDSQILGRSAEHCLIW